jgi:hypothetical protein
LERGKLRNERVAQSSGETLLGEKETEVIALEHIDLTMPET